MSTRLVPRGSLISLIDLRARDGMCLSLASIKKYAMLIQMEHEGISFRATLFKLSTTTDGGIRIQLDIPETDSEVAKQILDLKNSVLAVGIVAEPGY